MRQLWLPLTLAQPATPSWPTFSDKCFFVRRLLTFTAQQHSPGRLNHMADTLSRDNSSSFSLSFPRLHPTPSSSPSSFRCTLRPIPSVNITVLGQGLFCRGLADLSSRTYILAKKCYLDFCKSANLQSLPLAQDKLCLFTAFLSSWHQPLFLPTSSLPGT